MKTWSEFLQCQISYEAFDRIVRYPTDVVSEREQTGIHAAGRHPPSRRWLEEAAGKPQNSSLFFLFDVFLSSGKRNFSCYIVRHVA